MFVKESDIIELEVYYRKNGRQYEALTSTEYKTLMKDDDKDDDKGKKEGEKEDKYKVINIKMKELTWGLYNDFQEVAMVDDGRGLGERIFNFKIYKETRLRYLLSGWDAIDEKGKPVAVTATIISSLAPPIAEAILRGYDEISYLDEEEEKN